MEMNGNSGAPADLTPPCKGVTSVLGRLFFLVDDSAQNSAVVPHAREWARLLRMPVSGVSLGDLGPPVSGLRRFLLPADFLLVSNSFLASQKRDVLRWVLRTSGPAVLICPDAWQPLLRMLVIDDGNNSGEQFLAQSVVLTVARTEKAAMARQQIARRVFADFGIAGDFDFIVGSEVRVAVANVARWRRSQLIVMEQQSARPWRRWLRGNPVEQLINRLNTFSFLMLPEVSGHPFAPPDVRPPLASIDSLPVNTSS